MKINQSQRSKSNVVSSDLNTIDRYLNFRTSSTQGSIKYPGKFKAPVRGRVQGTTNRLHKTPHEIDHKGNLETKVDVHCVSIKTDEAIIDNDNGEKTQASQVKKPGIANVFKFMMMPGDAQQKTPGIGLEGGKKVPTAKKKKNHERNPRYQHR